MFSEVTNGRPRSATYNLGRDHDFIELFQNSKHRIFSIAAPLYQDGHSLKEISAMTGISYSTLNDELKKNNVQLRPNKSVSSSVVFQQKFKSSTPPPYGFTYMGGQLEKDGREYPTLLIIHRQWQLGQSATAIANHLNGKKLKSRSQKTWSRNVILNIIERLENKTIAIERG